MNTSDQPVRVAIQGIHGSFHHEATIMYFGTEAELKTCLSFKNLIQLVSKGEASHGIMAVENSLAGSMLPNLSLVRESGLNISGEIYMRISQNLMALPNQSIQQINEVHSHPLAIAQCEAFFEKHPHIRPVETTDTALSAKELATSKQKGTAVIGAVSAAHLYGLNIMCHSIETSQENYTRFLLLEKQATGFTSTGKVKACLAFTIPNKPGSLASVLGSLARQNADLSMIQSLPLVGQSWEYIFHADMIFPTLAMAKSTIGALADEFDRTWLMGVFPVTEGLGTAQQPKEPHFKHTLTPGFTNQLQTTNEQSIC